MIGPQSVTARLLADTRELDDVFYSAEPERSEAQQLKMIAIAHKQTIERLRAENAQSQLQVQSLQNQILNIASPTAKMPCYSCQKTSENYFSLKRLCTQLQAELDQMKNLPLPDDDKSAYLAEELSASRADAKQKDTTIKHLREYIDFLLQQIQELQPFQQQCEHLSQQILDLKAEQGEFISQLSDSRLQVSMARSQLRESQITEQKPQVSENQLDELYEQLYAMDALMAYVQEQKERIAELSNERADQKQELSRRDAERQKAESEAQSLRIELSYLKGQISAQTSLQARIDFLETQVRQARESEGLLRYQQEIPQNACRLEGENAVLRDKIDQQADQIIALQQQNAELKVCLGDAKLAALRIEEEFQARLDAEQRQLTRTTCELDACRQNDDTSRLRDENKALLEKLQAAEQSFRAEFEKGKVLAQEVQRGAAYIQECEAKGEAFQRDIQTLISSQKEGIEKIKMLQQENSRLEAQLKEAQKESQYLTDENKGLKEQMQINSLLNEVQNSAESFGSRNEL